jgi:two-component system chemotaxis response regulator CheB
MSIKVLVVDDSPLIRSVLSKVLNNDAGITVIGTAKDPIDARQKIKDLNPDVLTLDIEMPNMNGLDFLDKLMRLKPMPVVMVSTLTKKGAEETLLALELGAVDFVAKPGANLTGGIDAFGEEVCKKVHAAAKSSARSRGMRAPTPKVTIHTAKGPKGSLIAIGASTGGVEAIREVITSLPKDCPPIVITQHMPEGFTARFASRLNDLCEITVQEASDRMIIEAGNAYIAKGGQHLRIEKSSGQLKCRLGEDEEVSGHKPSVDVLFSSVAKTVGKMAIGVILTGMGRDGAIGMKEMRDAGSFTLGQSETSALVYGMPKVAFEEGAVVEQAPVEAIATRLVSAISKL